MKTATLERYAVFGTSRHMQRLTYRGELVGYAMAQCSGQETVAAMLAHAHRAGFDRVKFVGDWDRLTVRKTMRTGSAT